MRVTDGNTSHKTNTVSQIDSTVMIPLPFCISPSLPGRFIVCVQLLEAVGDGCDETDGDTSGSGSDVDIAEYCFRFRSALLVAPPDDRHRQ